MGGAVVQRIQLSNLNYSDIVDILQLKEYCETASVDLFAKIAPSRVLLGE